MPRTVFGREPVVILNAVQAVLLVGVALSIPYITDVSVPLIVAFIGAGLSAVQAVYVRPIAPAAFTGVVTAAAPLLMFFGLDVSEEMVVAVNGAIVGVMTLVIRHEVSPKYDLAA